MRIPAQLALWISGIALVAIPATGAPREPWTTGKISGSPEPPPPYQLERVFPRLKFTNPVDVSFAAGSDRVFVVEQQGKIWSFPNDASCDRPDLFTDLKAEVRGLEKIPQAKGVSDAFGLTFHPHFQQNHYCFITYMLRTAPGQVFKDGQRLSRFIVLNSDSAPHIDPASEVVLLTWQAGGHMGACMKFGPDGCLYVSSGDAADPAPPDSYHTGQDISDLLSSVMRIDVDHLENGRAYAIPKDNPFVTYPGARPEVWAYGLRNPWKMSFDRATGKLWAGDVGWELWEMIYRVDRGGNYGWSIMEGPHPVYPDAKPGPTPIIKPELSLPHSESASITGGYVYRGKRLPELTGDYIFGDWETRRIWAAKCDGEHLGAYRTIAQTEQRIISFGEDHQGELLVLDYEGGGLYRIAPNPDRGRISHFPRRLSETGLFASVPQQSPAAGVVPFSINAAQWNDGAIAERFVAVPGQQPVKWENDKKVWPKDSVLVRTFSLELEPGKPSTRKRVETQLLHFDGRWWNGYTYQWNDEQTDADLVDAAGSERAWSVPDLRATGGKRERIWHYPSRAQCVTCHTSWADYTLGYNAQQLSRTGAAESKDQLQALRSLRLFPPAQAGKAADLPALTDPHDASNDLTARARAYLHANCAHCHRPAGGGAAMIDLRDGPTDPHLPVIDARPVSGDFGIAEARIVAPADPARSVLALRMAKLGRGRMPHIGSYVVDPEGVNLIASWIGQLPPAKGSVEPKTLEVRARETAALKEICTGGPQAAAAVDRLLVSPSGALDLLLSIDRLSPTAREQVIAKATASSSDVVRDLFERFLPPEKLVKRLGPNVNSAELLALSGNPERGRQIFFQSSGGLCAQCHQIGGQGQSFGPDLSHIASKYDRAALLENILFPSRTIDPQFVTYSARTTDGDDVTGLLVEKTDQQVVLKDLSRQLVRLPAAKVARLAAQTVSAMPEGLLSALTAQDSADLLAFLAAQK